MPSPLSGWSGDQEHVHAQRANELTSSGGWFCCGEEVLKGKLSLSIWRTAMDSQHGQTHAETVFLARFFTSLKEKCGKRKPCGCFGDGRITFSGESWDDGDQLPFSGDQRSQNDLRVCRSDQWPQVDAKSLHPSVVHTLFHYWKLPHLQVAAIFQTYCDIATKTENLWDIFPVQSMGAPPWPLSVTTVTPYAITLGISSPSGLMMGSSAGVSWLEGSFLSNCSHP